MKHRSGPCLEKNCSWCCDPVKVPKDFPEEQIPVDKDGNKIWHERGEIISPENHIETVKIKTYDCVNLDPETGKCRDYDHRPEICKNSSCINEDSNESINAQHQKMINEKFVILNRSMKK